MRSEQLYLVDILDAIEAIERFTSGIDERLRVQLAMRLNDPIKERKLTQTAAANHPAGLVSVLVAA